MMQQLGLAPGPPTPEATEEAAEFGDPHRAASESGADIEANKAVYARMVEEVVNQGNFEVVEEIFHPTTSTTSRRPARTPGLAGVKEIFTMFRTGFPDVKFHDRPDGRRRRLRRHARPRRGNADGAVHRSSRRAASTRSGARSASSASRTA